MTATQEFVVPKSIPITFPIKTSFLSAGQTIGQCLAATSKSVLLFAFPRGLFVSAAFLAPGYTGLLLTARDIGSRAVLCNPSFDKKI
ncbi:MAG TPA: hypothetical protein DCS82_04650 [Rhodospirillaceae bacterium]|nr:hypothetical protein [Rhodospirillaceae bacterium]|tara:strand:- start:1861 stop:2121 length:261 start_codon:yes stop_codon:yes gene_type:complete